MPPKAKKQASSSRTASTKINPFLPEILTKVLVFAELDYFELCELRIVSKEWKEAIESPLLSHITFHLPPKGSPLIQKSITLDTRRSFEIHPVFEELSFACGSYKDFYIIGNGTGNLDTWEIDSDVLAKVLKESAVWPPVQRLGGGLYTDDFEKGDVKKAKGGVTVEQVLRSIGDLCDHSDDLHAKMGDHIFAEAWGLDFDKKKETGYVVITGFGS